MLNLSYSYISGDGTKKRPTKDNKMEGLVKSEQRETVGSREQNEQGMVLHRMTLVVNVAQSSPTLCDPMDYTVHGILLARILE